MQHEAPIALSLVTYKDSYFLLASRHIVWLCAILVALCGVSGPSENPSSPCPFTTASMAFCFNIASSQDLWVSSGLSSSGKQTFEVTSELYIESSGVATEFGAVV